MSDCCCNGQPAASDAVEVKCPQCGVVGKPVSTVTLKHMVKPEFLDAVNAPGFRFCRSADCDVIYFHASGLRLNKRDVRVRVGLKETDDPVPVCYCFGFTEAVIRKEIQATGHCTVSQRICAEIKAGNCVCEIRNPQGSCCLGNVAAAIKRAMKFSPVVLPDGITNT
jgi:hypothetical protein